MNDKNIPYLPISEFDVSTVTKEFLDLKNEESKESNFDLRNLTRSNLSEEIVLILLGMGMEMYIPLFQKINIALDSFLNINESELEEIGITNADDRRTIIKNLSFHQKGKENLIVSENHNDDLNIIKNVHYQLLLLQNYCAYVELQMRKQPMTDYAVDSENTACTFLKTFAECALTQSQLMSNRIYQENDFEALIEKILKTYNLTLPKQLANSLPKKKRKKKFLLKVIVFLGCSSLLVLTGRYLMRRC